MEASKCCFFIPGKSQIGAIEMASIQLNKLINIAEESSCQGEKFSSRIIKENLSLEQAIKLSNLLNENETFKG